MIRRGAGRRTRGRSRRAAADHHRRLRSHSASGAVRTRGQSGRCRGRAASGRARRRPQPPGAVTAGHRSHSHGRGSRRSQSRRDASGPRHSASRPQASGRRAGSSTSQAPCRVERLAPRAGTGHQSHAPARPRTGRRPRPRPARPRGRRAASSRSSRQQPHALGAGSSAQRRISPTPGTGARRAAVAARRAIVVTGAGSRAALGLGDRAADALVHLRPPPRRRPSPGRGGGGALHRPDDLRRLAQVPIVVDLQLPRRDQHGSPRPSRRSTAPPLAVIGRARVGAASGMT